MSLTTMQKFAKVMDNLALDPGWYYEGEDPETEEIFLKNFKRVLYTDINGNAVLTSEPHKFGTTWRQIKSEMDKL
jgi:hypothetical protein